MKLKKVMLGAISMSMVLTLVGPVSIMGADITPITANASATVKQGRCGDNAIYKYDEQTKTVTISGSGDMWDDAGIDSVMGDAEHIIIEEGIKSIGAYSFSTIQKLKSIVIAKSVTTINKGAVPYVDGDLVIPASVKKIQTKALGGAKNVIFEGDVNGYEPLIFESGSYISEVTLNGAAQNLGNALVGSYVEKITISENNSKCKIRSGNLISADGKTLYYYFGKQINVVVPDSVEKISVAAFYRSEISKITLGKNVKTIEAFAFANSYSLKNIELNSKLKSIGTKAFYNTYIKRVSLPGKVKLGVHSFSKGTTVRYKKSIKRAQTTVISARIKKNKYSVRYLKVDGAKGYQVRIQNGKKKYNYYTTKTSISKKSTKSVAKNYTAKKVYSIQNNEYLKKVKKAITVTVRPYKLVKGKKVYGRWSTKTVINRY